MYNVYVDPLSGHCQESTNPNMGGKQSRSPRFLPKQQRPKPQMKCESSTHPLVTDRVQVTTSLPQKGLPAPRAPTPGWGPQHPSTRWGGGREPRGQVEPSSAPSHLLLLLAAQIPLLGVLKVMFSVSGNILHDTSEAEAPFRGI